MKLRIKALLSGAATYLPGHHFMHGTGGTDTARYCYSVWLRHLILSQRAGCLREMPLSVAELGPGDSIGIGLAALLCGVEQYRALDVVPYSNLGSNLAIFDELVTLFERRAPIPGPNEFPSLLPAVERYEFPYELLTEARLASALSAPRVESIRASISRVNEAGSRITYLAPWTDPSVIQEQSVDMIYSQAVLEHIDDLTGVYSAMRQWLKPEGFLSHQIDYRSHGKADEWNGHWRYSDLAWKVVVGRRKYLLNRQPHSSHMRYLAAAGFRIVQEWPVRCESALTRGQLATRFRDLSADDQTTCGAYILAAPAIRSAS